MTARATTVAGWAALAALVVIHASFVALGSIDALRSHTEVMLFGPLAIDVALGTAAFVLGVVAMVKARKEKRSVLWALPVVVLGALAASGACCFGTFVWALGESFSGYGPVV